MRSRKLLESLKQAAIDEDPMAVDLEQMFGPVTVRAAPRNVSFTKTASDAARDDETDR